jgi:hypothetical protein
MAGCRRGDTGKRRTISRSRAASIEGRGIKSDGHELLVRSWDITELWRTFLREFVNRYPYMSLHCIECIYNEMKCQHNTMLFSFFNTSVPVELIAGEKHQYIAEVNVNALQTPYTIETHNYHPA